MVAEIGQFGLNSSAAGIDAPLTQLDAPFDRFPQKSPLELALQRSAACGMRIFALRTFQYSVSCIQAAAAAPD